MSFSFPLALLEVQLPALPPCKNPQNLQVENVLGKTEQTETRSLQALLTWSIAPSNLPAP